MELARQMSPSPRYREVEFASAGVMLRGHLYGEAPRRPPGPVVVMAHGLSATISGMVADLYAEEFAAAGLRVLLYDHHSFGKSGGAPRHQIDKWLQTRGYVDAVSYCRSLADVDAARIAVWGDSLSAPLAMIAAAVDERIAAVVAQVPGFGDEMPNPVADVQSFEQLREMLMRAELATLERKVSAPGPVVSPDQLNMPSRLTPITAFRWFMEFGGRFESGWENRVTSAEIVTSVPLDPVLCAARIKVPTMMVVADPDEMPNCDPDVALAVLGLVRGPTESLTIGGGHFGLLYPDSPHFTQVVEGQRDFLLRRLGAQGSAH